MNIKNLLVSAVIFSATITSFNTNTWGEIEISPYTLGGGIALSFVIGAAMGTQYQNNHHTFPKAEEIHKLNTILEEKEATIKDLLDKNSEIEDFEIIGKDGIVKMRQSFGDTLDSLNKHAQENHIILTDKMGRNHILCRGEKSAIFQNTRDFHKCSDFMDAFDKLSKKSSTTDNK